MIVGIRRKAQDGEFRFGLALDGLHELIGNGHGIRIERNAWIGAGFDYTPHRLSVHPAH